MNISINGSVVAGDISTGDVIINGNRVIVNGKDVTPDSKEITIQIDGDVASLKADICTSIAVSGSCGTIQTQSGDVEVKGDVNGSVNTMSGDVECGKVGGSVSTMSGKISVR